MSDPIINSLSKSPTGIEGLLKGDHVFTPKDAEYAYRTLVDAMNEGAAALAADGTVVYCNQRLAQLLGLPFEQIIGNPIPWLVLDETANVIEASIARAKSGDPVKAGLDLQTMGGRVVPVQLSMSVMESVEPNAICMVMTDLTESKARDAQIAAANLAT